MLLIARPWHPLLLLAAAAALAVFVSGCSRSQQTKAVTAETTAGPEPLVKPVPAEDGRAFVAIATSLGEIAVELDAKAAPITVANFLAYADKQERGGYDNASFHRVVPGFVIQGGGYTPDLAELPSDKPIRNEWPNGLTNSRGTIAMARDTDPHTATREFFINLKDNDRLDQPRDKTGKAGYAVFGRVIAGMDVVDRIGAVQTQPRPQPNVTDGSLDNVPVTPVVITSVRRITPAAAARLVERERRGAARAQRVPSSEPRPSA